MRHSTPTRNSSSRCSSTLSRTRRTVSAGKVQSLCAHDGIPFHSRALPRMPWSWKSKIPVVAFRPKYSPDSLILSSVRRKKGRGWVCPSPHESLTSTEGTWSLNPKSAKARCSASFCRRIVRYRLMADILIIEDDESVADSLRHMLEGEGETVETTSKSEHGLALAE